MREVVVMAIVAGICLSSLHSPIIGLLGYIWFALCRPDVLAWSHKPFSLILAIAVLFGSVRHLVSVPRIVANPISGMLLLQQFPVAMSVVLAVRTDLSTGPYGLYVRVILMSLLIPLMVESEEWLRKLYFVMVFSMGLIATKFGLFSALLSGGRIVSGFAGYYNDSNGLGLAMAILMPLAIYGSKLASHYLIKFACFGIAGLSMITLVSLGSRGNTLACAAVGLLMVLRSKYKLVGIVTMALVVVPAVYIGGDRFLARIGTVAEYEQDGSATSRLDYWVAALKTSRDYPLFGVGYGEMNYVALNTRYLGREDAHVVHNTYLQSLVDTGVPGFLLYTGTLLGTIFWLEFSRRRMKKLKPDWVAYPEGFQTALLAFALGSIFYSRQDFEFAYFVLMSAAAWYAIEKAYLKKLQAPNPVVNDLSRERSRIRHSAQVGAQVV